MSKVAIPSRKVVVPEWVTDHSSFVEWIDSGLVPDDARVCYIKGKVWIDDMPEQAFAHNLIKIDIATVLLPYVRRENLGLFFGDGMTYTNKAEKFTSVPDGMFVSQDAINTGRVGLWGGKRSRGDTQLVGIPDLVIEIVSNHSEKKDTNWLLASYEKAGIPEYWLVDARSEPLRFTIYRHDGDHFAAVRESDGWAKSNVLGRSFRFVPAASRMGFATFQFEMR